MTTPGGLVGYNNSGSISGSYATGNATVAGVSSSAGGLLGYNSMGSISGSYARGNATATGSLSSAGGLVGQNAGGTISSDSYFDSDMSSATDGVGNDDTIDIGKTTAELLGPEDYSGIYAVWNVDVDNGLPVGVDDGTTAGDSGRMMFGTLGQICSILR